MCITQGTRKPRTAVFQTAAPQIIVMSRPEEDGSAIYSKENWTKKNNPLSLPPGTEEKNKRWLFSCYALQKP